MPRRGRDHRRRLSKFRLDCCFIFKRAFVSSSYFYKGCRDKRPPRSESPAFLYSECLSIIRTHTYEPKQKNVVTRVCVCRSKDEIKKRCASKLPQRHFKFSTLFSINLSQNKRFFSTFSSLLNRQRTVLYYRNLNIDARGDCKPSISLLSI
jgi:hypothetical protein